MTHTFTPTPSDTKRIEAAEARVLELVRAAEKIEREWERALEGNQAQPASSPVALAELHAARLAIERARHDVAERLTDRWGTSGLEAWRNLALEAFEPVSFEPVWKKATASVDRLKADALQEQLDAKRAADEDERRRREAEYVAELERRRAAGRARAAVAGELFDAAGSMPSAEAVEAELERRRTGAAVPA